MHTTRWLLILLLLLGCATRKHEPKLETQPTTAEETTLPEGVVVSRNKLYLVKADPAELKPGEENEISYSVIDADFEAVDLKKVKIEITYIMPSMPQMGVFKATAGEIDENTFTTTLDIVHGGDWRVTVALTPEGATAAEEIVFEYDVK